MVSVIIKWSLLWGKIARAWAGLFLLLYRLMTKNTNPSQKLQKRKGNPVDFRRRMHYTEM